MALITLFSNLNFFLALIWGYFKAAFVFGHWVALSSDDFHSGNSSDSDLESGVIPHATCPQPLNFIRIIGQILLNSRCIVFSLNSISSILASTGSVAARGKDYLREDVFVDLVALRTRCRVKLLSRGQRYASLPSTSLNRERKTRLTGKQLVDSKVSPGSHGVDLRKWTLIKKNRFPNNVSLAEPRNNDILSLPHLGVSPAATPDPLASTSPSSNPGGAEPPMNPEPLRPSRLRRHFRSVDSFSGLNEDVTTITPIVLRV